MILVCLKKYFLIFMIVQTRMKIRSKQNIFYLRGSDRDHIWFLVLLVANAYCVGCSKPQQRRLPSHAIATISFLLYWAFCITLLYQITLIKFRIEWQHSISNWYVCSNRITIYEEVFFLKFHWLQVLFHFLQETMFQQTNFFFSHRFM